MNEQDRLFNELPKEQEPKSKGERSNLCRENVGKEKKRGKTVGVEDRGNMGKQHYEERYMQAAAAMQWNHTMWVFICLIIQTKQAQPPLPSTFNFPSRIYSPLSVHIFFFLKASLEYNRIC